MLAVHCVIHRENLFAENVAPTLHEILYSVIKCINLFKANAKTELCSRSFARLVMHIIGSCVTRDLSQGEILAEGGPPANTHYKIEK